MNVRAALRMILLDEVVAFACQLRGLDYDTFHALEEPCTLDRPCSNI